MIENESKKEMRWILLDSESSAAGDLPVAAEPFPPRDPGDLTDLISSVRLHGVLCPVVVRVVGGQYQLVCGYRRYLAALEAGLLELPALVTEMEDAAAIRSYLASKLLRRALSPSEQEAVFRMLRDLRDGKSIQGSPRRPQDPSPFSMRNLREGGEKRTTNPMAGMVPEWTAPTREGRGVPRVTAELTRLTPDGQARQIREEIGSYGDVSGASLLSPADEGDRLAGALHLHAESLFSQIRLQRVIDVDAANCLASELLKVLDGSVPVDLRRLSGGGAGDITASHSLLVAALCAYFGRFLDWNADEVFEFVVAGLLHDLGMVFVRSPYLREPRSLTQAERGELHSHTRIGYALISGTGSWSETVALCARDHHERWDGSGYPMGVQGSRTAFPARLMGLLDTYAALITPRPHRDALEPEAASQKLFQALELGLHDPSFHLLLKATLEHSPLPGLQEPRGEPGSTGNSVELPGEIATMLSKGSSQNT